jgi:DNA-binding beta-propeller fold protein YncE
VSCRPKPVLLALALALIAGGCTSKAKAPAPHTAAEPAVAPSTTVAPAGSVVAVGAQPQGIVYDPVTKLVAVAVRNPDRLVLLDGSSLRIVRQVPLAGHARHLQLAEPGGPVVVPEEDKNQLALVSLRTGATTVIPTGTSPHDAAAVTGGYVAGDEFGSSITIARTGQAPQTVGGVEQPGGVIDLGDTVAIVDVKGYTLSTYRVADGSKLASVAAGAGPTHGIKAADGSILVADTRGNQVLDFGTNPLSQQGSLGLPGSPYGLAADSSGPLIWVSLTGRNQVVGLSLEHGAVREVARLDTVQQPDTVAVAPGSHTIWIAGDTPNGVVQRLTR